MASPRDKYLTVYGRKPVLEALEGGLPVARVHLADGAGGEPVERILRAASARGVQVRRAPGANAPHAGSPARPRPHGANADDRGRSVTSS